LVNPSVVHLRPIPRPGDSGAVAFPKSGKIPKGKTFVIGHWWSLEGFPHPNQPLSGQGIVRSFYELIFNRLIEKSPFGQIRRGLAVEWKSEGNHWQLRLREGVQFHNGKPLIVEDVISTYEQYLRLNPQEHLIEGVDPLDAGWIQIRVKSRCRLEEISMPFILPQGVSDSGTEWSGTGAFEAIELNPDFWRLRRNPDYFLSPPYFEEVHIRQYSDTKALQQALIDGIVHFGMRVESPGAGFITQDLPTPVRYHLHFMFNHPLVQNCTLRQAIACALDREALAKAAGFEHPVYSSGAFDSILEDQWQTPPPAYPEIAKQLLQQVPSLKDSVFRLAYNQAIPESTPLAAAIVEQLKQIGIRATIGEMSDAHACLLLRPTERIEHELSMWESQTHWNLNGYSNPKVDRLIRHLRDVYPSRSQLLKLRRLIQKDLPDIPLFFYATPLTYVQNLRISENRMDMVFFKEVHAWYLEDETVGHLPEAEKGKAASSA
jgi:peptide/nickel transport system substrate-binding protein